MHKKSFSPLSFKASSLSSRYWAASRTIWANSGLEAAYCSIWQPTETSTWNMNTCVSLWIQSPCYMSDVLLKKMRPGRESGRWAGTRLGCWAGSSAAGAVDTLPAEPGSPSPVGSPPRNSPTCSPGERAARWWKGLQAGTEISKLCPWFRQTLCLVKSSLLPFLRAKTKPHQ